MVNAQLALIFGVLVTGAVVFVWLRFMVFCSREARHNKETPLTALLAARRRAVTAARHAALEPVKVVSVTRVNERKALP